MVDLGLINVQVFLKTTAGCECACILRVAEGGKGSQSRGSTTHIWLSFPQDFRSELLTVTSDAEKNVNYCNRSTKWNFFFHS